MNIIQAMALGIVEGLTEFLPISSTFHLIWTAHLFSIADTEFLRAFEVIIQGGAILAVSAIYFQTVLTNTKLIKNLIVSFFPTAALGFILYKVIKETFFSELTVQIFVFVLIGVLFLLFEKYLKKELHRTTESLQTKEAFIIGIAQALAIFPGVSRAGAVMVALMMLGFKRDEAAKYSFLLAVPTLLAASFLDLIKSKDVIFASSENIPLLLIGTIVSFASALFVVKWFIRFLQRKDLTVFGWYRILLGIVLFFIK